MKKSLNKSLDVAYIQLRKGKVHSTFEVRPGLLLDLNKGGEVMGIEILSAEKLAPQIQVKKKSKSQVA